MPEKQEPALGGFGAERSGGGSVADCSPVAQEVATFSGGDTPPTAAAEGPRAGGGVLGRNRATSNSTVHPEKQSGLPLVGIWSCLDRITFLCQVKEAQEDDFRRWLNGSANVSALHGSSTPGFRQCATFAGCGVVEIGDRASGAGVSSGLKLRFDFNPQKVPASALTELAPFLYLDSLTYTRVDVAIDYARALGDCSCEHDGLRKVATYGFGADCTGWTFGSRKGARYTRVYDKRREREDKNMGDDSLLKEIGDLPLWRVEVESRPHGSADPLPPGLFDGLRIRYLSAEPLNYRELALLRACLADPSFLKKIPTGYSRQKANALLAGCADELSPTPAQVYAAMRSTLKLDLLAVSLCLSGGEVVSHAPMDSDVLQAQTAT